MSELTEATAPTFAGKPLEFDGPGVIHYLARHLAGAFVWPLPLCWDAEAKARFPDDTIEQHDDGWWLSVDHGALDPTRLVATTDRDVTTCRDCLGWLHA